MTMEKTYGVSFQDIDGKRYSGTAELLARHVRLDGDGHVIEIPYDRVAGVRFGEPDEQLAGRRSLVLDLRDGGRIRLASVVDVSVLSDLSDRLAALQPGRLIARRRVLAVVPLRPGAREDVERLLAKGPPFDPKATGLLQHQAFVTDTEAIFFFEARNEDDLENLMTEPALLQAAAAWLPYVAGPAKVADEAFSWVLESPNADAS